MLQFDSTITHQWIFDTDVIDLMIISDEVAQLLTKKLGQLPTPLVQAMKIISCIGYQINRSTIDLLNINSQSQFNMENMLQMAINEGLIERAVSRGNWPNLSTPKESFPPSFSPFQSQLILFFNANYRVRYINSHTIQSKKLSTHPYLLIAANFYIKA